MSTCGVEDFNGHMFAELIKTQMAGTILNDKKMVKVATAKDKSCFTCQKADCFLKKVGTRGKGRIAKCTAFKCKQWHSGKCKQEVTQKDK